MIATTPGEPREKAFKLNRICDITVEGPPDPDDPEVERPPSRAPDQVLNRPGSAAGKPVRAFWDRPGLWSPAFPSFPFMG